MTTYFAAYRFLTSLPWYIIRASGIVAAASLTLLLITGVTMFTGHEYKILEPLKAWANHRNLGIIFGVSVLIHTITILFDTYEPFSLTQIFVPFTSHYRPYHLGGLNLGSLGVALGILASYALIMLMYTSRVKGMTTRPKLWKWTHYLSYLILVMVFFHTLMIGTDVAKGLGKFIWYGLNFTLLGFVLLRLTRTGSLNN